MNLSEILREDGIVLNLAARDKWEAIQKLVRTLDKGPMKKTAAKPVLDALIARENVASTGMEHGIALPHAKVMALESPVAALGLCPAGLNFQSPGNEPARIIVLLAFPIRQVHVRTLASVAHMLNFEEFRHALLQAKSAQEVLKIIREEEQKQPLAR